MNNYSTNNPTLTNVKKSDNKFLSGQKTGKTALSEVKEAVRVTNKAQQFYDKLRAERNRAICQYLSETDAPDAVLQLSYEIKISPVTIYNILKIQKKGKEAKA